jgi:hypothetical protein
LVAHLIWKKNGRRLLAYLRRQFGHLEKHGENAFEGAVAPFAEGRKWEREKMSGSNLKGAVAQFAEICEKGHFGICVGICEHLEFAFVSICVSSNWVSQSIARA